MANTPTTPPVMPTKMPPPAAPKPMAQAPKHHSHVGMWVLVIIFILATITVTGLALMLFGEKTTTEGSVADLESDVTLLQVDLQNANASLETAQQELEAANQEIMNLQNMDADVLKEIVAATGDGYIDYHGIAVFEGFYSTNEEVSVLLGANPEEEYPEGIPTELCDVFVVTDGSLEAMQHLSKKASNDELPLRIVLGDAGGSYESLWFGTPELTDSSSTDPVKAIFSMGSRFEGEMVGCFNAWEEFISTMPK